MDGRIINRWQVPKNLRKGCSNLKKKWPWCGQPWSQEAGARKSIWKAMFRDVKSGNMCVLQKSGRISFSSCNLGNQRRQTKILETCPRTWSNFDNYQYFRLVIWRPCGPPLRHTDWQKVSCSGWRVLRGFQFNIFMSAWVSNSGWAGYIPTINLPNMSWEKSVRCRADPKTAKLPQITNPRKMYISKSSINLSYIQRTVGGTGVTNFHRCYRCHRFSSISPVSPISPVWSWM